MVDTSWAERRRRMVKCKIHGLHFDPEMSTGCTRCLREAAKTQPQRPPQLVLILLCILGMAFILLYIFGPGGQAAPAVDLGIASAQVSAAQKLDPEPFRQPIESLETALFRTPIDETDDLLVVSADVSASSRYLSTRILEDEPTEGLAAADLIARLGQAVPTNQVALTDIQQARRQWLRIREQRLLSADWFIDPEDLETSLDTSSFSEYSAIASSLRSLIDDGLTEVQILSDQAATFPADGEGSPAERWRLFIRDWQGQISSVASRMPSRPSARADGRLLLAIQDLEQALTQVRALATDPNLPSISDNRFDDATNAALRAQQGFDDLLN